MFKAVVLARKNAHPPAHVISSSPTQILHNIETPVGNVQKGGNHVDVYQYKM